MEDDLSSLGSESVPEEVRLWLAATFAKQEQVLHYRHPVPTPSWKPPHSTVIWGQLELILQWVASPLVGGLTTSGWPHH